MMWLCVQTIGQELRSLLASVDEIVNHLPQDNMKQVNMPSLHVHSVISAI